ncbi:uncharacterized protein [Asterias amurensis]|uniref:uncharacterized protein isoform X2 n=1 Tax=Asterias amurensis TaxID=7602 RepID=UPI003AB84A3B
MITAIVLVYHSFGCDIQILRCEFWLFCGHIFRIMTSGNRLKFVLISLTAWSVLSSVGGEGTGIGGDGTRFRRRRDYHGGYPDENEVTTCNCASQSSNLECKTPISGCEPGELQHNNSCYRFETGGKSRDDSVEDCIQHYSHLVYVETREEQTFLAGTLRGNSSLRGEDYWLGLVAVDVTYVWINGNASIASMLLSRIEDDGGNCVFLRFGGFFVAKITIQTGDCNEYKRSICEKTDQACDEYPNSCYAVSDESTETTTRDEASDACSDLGGHLLYIETDEELESIRTSNLPDGDYWIGLNVIRYRWMDGTPALFDTFESRNGDDGNECFRIRHNKNFQWNDKSCSVSYGRICERRTMASVVSGTDWCQSSIPYDLMRLTGRGALCFDAGDDSSTPVLRRCNTGDNVEGCSCYKETDKPVKCSCGFCKLSSNEQGQELWPSEFNCSCSSSLYETNFTIIKPGEDAGFQCPSDGTPATPISTGSQMTTSMSPVRTTTDDRTLPPSTTRQLYISSHGTFPVVTAGAETSSNRGVDTATSTGPVTSSTTEEKGNGTGDTAASNGGATAAGVILAIVFLVLLLVVACFVWRRKGRKLSEERSERSGNLRAAKNPGASGQPETDNPAYGLDEIELSRQNDLILKPVQGVGVHGASNPTYAIGDERENSVDYTNIKSPDVKSESRTNTYTDIQPRGYEAYRPNPQPDPYTSLKGATKDHNENDGPAIYTPNPDNTGESYATIASSGYTAYNPTTERDDDVYTDPKSTRDTNDDDPLVYTPIPNNDRGKPTKKVTDDDDDRYVGLEDVVPQRPVAATSTTTPSAPRGSDDAYVDFDAEPRVLKPIVSPKKKSGDNGNYVSMDVPTSEGNEGDYYYKLENSNAPHDVDTEAAKTPQEDHTYNSLDINARKIALRHNNAVVPDNNTYNSFDRTPMRHDVPKGTGQSSAQGNIHGKGNAKDTNAYDVINRTGRGVKHPVIVADDGDYSLTVPVPRDDTYNSFDRSHHDRNNKLRPKNQASENEYGSLENTDDGEYSTLN